MRSFSERIYAACRLSRETPSTGTPGIISLSVSSYRYYAVGINIDGEDYTVKIVVGVEQGKKYYDHRLTEMEKSRLIDVLNQPASDFTTAENASLPPYVKGKDTKLIDLLHKSLTRTANYWWCTMDQVGIHSKSQTGRPYSSMRHTSQTI